MSEQLARGIWTGFSQSSRPFQDANAMLDNLRLIDDHIGFYTLQAPVAPDAALPGSPVNGDGQIFTDGTYAVFNAGNWTQYPARRGIKAALLNGADYWINAGDEWVSIFNDKAFEFDSVQDMLDGVAVPGKSVALQIGMRCVTGGYNVSSDGGWAAFEVVGVDDSVGILNTAGTLKFKRMAGHDQLKRTLANIAPVIAAHRGYSGIVTGEPVGSSVQEVYFVPENTLQAVKFAASQGAWAFEGDTKITADDQLVIFHDTTVDRTTPASGNVSSFTLAELKALDAGSYVSPRYADARVMDYNDWFYWCRKVSIVPMPELSLNISDAQADAYVSAMHKYYPNGRGVIATGTSISTLQKIRTRSAECAVAIGTTYGSPPTEDQMNQVYALGNAGVIFTGTVLSNHPESVALAKDRGLFTIFAVANTPARWEQCVNLGIDIVITDVLSRSQA